jgi:hypothetical protein
MRLSPERILELQPAHDMGVILVDDGTWEILLNIKNSNQAVEVLALQHNMGKAEEVRCSAYWPIAQRSSRRYWLYRARFY